MSSDEDVSELKDAFRESPHPTLKISSYFAAYAALFAHLRGRQCTFVETGVLDGGSLFMWRRWLGPGARIVGIDLNPAALRWRDQGFEIHIGDQGDPAFWQRVLPEIGRVDAFLDDGGHQSFQQAVTLFEVLRHATTPGVIAVEDTAASQMSDFGAHGPHNFLELAKASTDMLTARMAGIYPQRMPRVVNPDAAAIWAKVQRVSFFPGIVAWHVDPALVEMPALMRNRPPSDAADFRYKGRDAATVRWPDPYVDRLVTIHGGGMNSGRFRKIARALLSWRRAPRTAR